MKKFIKQDKGISLITLGITVIIILVITEMLIYNAKDGIYVKNLYQLRNDIQNLREKVSEYYNEYEKIPASVEYTNQDNILQLNSVLNEKEKSNESKFYVIDLQAMQGISLNYGEEYENIKNTEVTQISEYTDIYIINNITHNIFYVAGIPVKQDNETKMYYTDYTEPDNTYVDFRYVDGVKIPKEFYYVGGNKEEGIVISDVQGDDLSNSKGGNQFVWVPVENFNEFKREDFGNQNIPQSDFISTEPTEGKYYEETSDGTSFATETEKMYESVRINKGFYIGRFEAGIEGDTARNSSSTISDRVVVQKNKNIYNYIQWGNSIDDENGGAVEKARSMYQDENTYGVTSTLCYGVQWDAIMRWINQDEQLNNIFTDSSSIGNYSGTLAKTGSKEEYKTKNIYDLSGNAYEMTMETGDIEYKVQRGGGCSDSGLDSTITFRKSKAVGLKESETTFRLALYLNVEKDMWSETYTDIKKYTDINGDVAYIPKGFQVSLSPSMNEIKNGLVIRDATGDSQTNGSEFVWVPVKNYDDFHLIEGYWNGNLDSLLSEESNPSREAGSNDTSPYTPGKPNEANSTVGTTESIAMYKSVKDNGGFYIARYEAGIISENDENGKPKDNYSLKTKTATDGTVKPLSRAGLGVWNNIAWGGSSSDTSPNDGLPGNDNANGAVKVARSMYNNPYTGNKNTNTTVKSTLCYGVQWGAVMNFIDSDYVNGRATGYVKNSTDKGNYSEEIATTGSSDNYAVNNIYDMAGNVCEWTMEAYDADCRVNRGGGYFDTGFEFPASGHNYPNPGTSIGYIGFRVALYL